jgi:Ni/Fe-hydrogenase 1 B-type cytochrome subunit
MGVWKRLHYGFMGVIMANLIARIIYAFTGETKTYKDFALGKKDILNTPEVIKYYLFLQDDYPHVAKFASLQKLTYNMFWILLMFQAITGMAILLPEIFLDWMHLSIFDSTLLMHIIHVTVSWFFIFSTTIHAYMSITEGYPLLKLMMFNIEPDMAEE